MKIWHRLPALSIVPVLALAFAWPVYAAWPEKTVRIIIPWPPGGSTDIVARVHAEFNNALTSPELLRRLDEQGAAPMKMSSAEFGRLMAAETTKWLEVIKAAGIKGE